MNAPSNTEFAKNPQGSCASMTVEFGAGRTCYLKSGSAAVSEVEIKTVREYANWGGEFMDDAFRSGEQPPAVSCDKPVEFEEDWVVANLA